MTIQQFKNINPGNEFVVIYYTDSPDTVSAINISTTDCNGNNIAEVLNELQEISININGTLVPFNIVNSQIFAGYYHFLLEDKEVTGVSSTTEGVCEIFYTKPPFLGTGFSKSEYQAILNNASSNRTAAFIYDVDRNNSQLLPSNYESIMSGSATKAQYQELNYSSIGIGNSRYSGAKTSIVDYGVSSALGVKLFDGSSYLSTIDNNYICSQSLSDRDIESFAYTGNTDFPVSGSRIFTFNKNKALPVRSRKVWVKENNRILQIDGNGYINSSGSLCSI